MLWMIVGYAIDQMSDHGRPASPLGVPDDRSGSPIVQGAQAGMRERFTRSVSLRSLEEVTPSTATAFAKKGTPTTGSSSRLSGNSARSTRRVRPPTVDFPGYRNMISQLQGQSAEAIRSRTQISIDRIEKTRRSSSTFSESGEEGLRYPDRDGHGEGSQDSEHTDHEHIMKTEDEQSFYPGFNSDTKDSKSKYYAVRRGR
jgi:hypothetical protein